MLWFTADTHFGHAALVTRGFRPLKSAIRDGIFTSVSYYTRIKQRNGIRAILCHYPIHSWQPGFVHLHGHSHGMLTPETPGRKDVGVDAQSFSPVSEGLVLEMPLRPEDDGRHLKDIVCL